MTIASVLYIINLIIYSYGVYIVIKIAVLDDNSEHIKDIKKLLFANPELDDYEVYEYISTGEFLCGAKSEKFDIVFLDIILDESDGIEVGRQLKQYQPFANIIFVSVNPDYFKDVYKVEHSYFLTKDFEPERFHDAVSKALRQINKGFITIHGKNEKIKLTLRDAVCFESILRHTKVYTVDGTIREFNVNIKEFESKLSAKDFVRVHKSFIVNLNHIEAVNRQTVTLKGNIEIPISRSYAESAKEKINLYLGEVL